MKVIHLNASNWQTPDDFYSALLPQLGAPSWHGRNLDALWDSLGDAKINEVKPPYSVEVDGMSQLSTDMREFLAKVVKVFDDTRKKFGDDVSITLRWSS